MFPGGKRNDCGSAEEMRAGAVATDAGVRHIFTAGRDFAVIEWPGGSRERFDHVRIGQVVLLRDRGHGQVVLDQELPATPRIAAAHI